MAHELKTPLTSTRSAAQSLREDWDTMSSEDRRDFLAMIDSDSRRLESKVEQLEDLSKAELLTVGKGDRAKVEEVLENIRKSNPARQISTNVTREAQRKEVAMAADTLDSILMSLIENAFEHGGGNVEVTISCDLVRSPKRSIQIKVHNDGREIPQANVENIFDPFFTTSPDKDSGGLGLSIVRALVKAHRGVIELVPSDSGTTFQIVLPHR